MTLNALVADLGGTRMRAALVDRNGRVSHRRSQPTDAAKGRDDVLARLVEDLSSIVFEASAGDIAGLGVSFAGSVDPGTGTIFNPTNMPGWEGFSPVSTLERGLGLRTRVNNDATLAALAEHAHGAGRGLQHMLYLTLSTGIGGGIIVNGELYVGRSGFAGEVGHMTIDKNGPRCECGNVGCLEAMASGVAVARMAREGVESGRSSSLRELWGSDEAPGLDAKAVAEAAAHGDLLANEILSEVSANLGTGIVSLLHAFDPEAIVVGGGMSESLDLLRPGIQREIDLHAMPQPQGQAPLIKAELGDDGSLIGAAAMVFSGLRSETR